MSLVSIIIPVYNTEKYIADTIISCLNQTYTNFELIIVNDGSTDNVESVIERFDDPRIRYFKIKNSGSCNARNFGLKQIRGKLIQFLDSDDVLDVHKIETQMEYYAKYGDNYIYSGIMGTVSDKFKTIDKGYDLYYRNFTPTQYFEILLNQFGKYLTTGVWLVPVKLINSTHGWNSKSGLNDDGEYFMRIILNSTAIIFSEKSIFYYRRDVPNSFSKQFTSKDVYVKWFWSYKSYVKNFKLKLDQETANYFGWKCLSVYYCNSYPKYPDLLEECIKQIRDLGYNKPNAHGGKFFTIMSKIIGIYNCLKLWDFKSRFSKKFI